MKARAAVAALVLIFVVALNVLVIGQAEAMQIAAGVTVEASPPPYVSGVGISNEPVDAYGQRASKIDKPKRKESDWVTQRAVQKSFLRGTFWVFIAGIISGLEAVLVFFGWHRYPKRGGR